MMLDINCSNFASVKAISLDVESTMNETKFVKALMMGHINAYFSLECISKTKIRNYNSAAFIS